MLVMEGGALSGLAGFVEQAWARAIAWQLSLSPCNSCAACVREPKSDKQCSSADHAAYLAAAEVADLQPRMMAICTRDLCCHWGCPRCMMCHFQQAW